MSTLIESPSAPPQLTPAQHLELYKRMTLIRAFEEKIDWLFARGLILGTTHLCIGQEASAVGVCAALRQGDQVIGNHRSHGHALALGLDPERLMGELLGKRNGYCAGIGGSQHVASAAEGFLGSNGITCGGLPIATGVAFALQRQGNGAVATVFIGDGATNQGVFHESMNLAAIWHLPLLVVCENNLYAMSTPMAATIAGADLTRRGAAYAMHTTVVDGMDVLAVYQAATECVHVIRTEMQPCFLIVNTYRFVGHSKSDMRKYRTREEEKQYRARDPLALFGAWLCAQQICTESELSAIKAGTKQLIEHCYSVGVACEPLDLTSFLALADA